ncbi:MAG TPA: glutathione S-transferase family protein [Burkholderiales bacterium]|nr:glutathione S-transferase family protein [Burkholderiales bacterium]
MKLYLNKASPYARLVLVVAHEKSLSDRIELVWTDPWQSRDELLNVNPFSKVPALVVGEETLIESGCICDYLDSVGGGRSLLPSAGTGPRAALVKCGWGRALIDAAFGTVIERRFAAAGSRSELGERWLAATKRALPVLEIEAGRLESAAPDLGDLAIAVGLSYIDFRLPEIEWRAGHARLATWFEALSARPSMRQTAPE